MTDNTLDSTAGACPQQVKFTLTGQLSTHFGFPECPCRLECNIYSRLCRDYGLMIFLLTADGQLFLTLIYLVPVTASILQTTMVTLNINVKKYLNQKILGKSQHPTDNLSILCIPQVVTYGAPLWLAVHMHLDTPTCSCGAIHQTNRKSYRLRVLKNVKHSY